MQKLWRSVVNAVHTRSVTHKLEKLTDRLVIEDISIRQNSDHIPKRSLYDKIVNKMCDSIASELPTHWVGESGPKCRESPVYDGYYLVTMIMPSVTFPERMKAVTITVQSKGKTSLKKYEDMADKAWSSQQSNGLNRKLREDWRSGMVGDVVVIRSDYADSVYMVCRSIGWTQVSPLTAMVILTLTDEQRLILLDRMLSNISSWSWTDKLSLVNDKIERLNKC